MGIHRTSADTYISLSMDSSWVGQGYPDSNEYIQHTDLGSQYQSPVLEGIVVPGEMIHSRVGIGNMSLKPGAYYRARK